MRLIGYNFKSNLFFPSLLNVHLLISEELCWAKDRPLVCFQKSAMYVQALLRHGRRQSQARDIEFCAGRITVSFIK